MVDTTGDNTGLSIPRNIDRISFFTDSVVIFFLFTYLFMFLTNRGMLSVFLSLAILLLWTVIMRGKPPGYVFHVFYYLGSKIPGFLPSPRRQRYYSD